MALTVRPLRSASHTVLLPLIFGAAALGVPALTAGAGAADSLSSRAGR